MDRKTFIKAGCVACTSIGFLSTILQSCASVKYAKGDLIENGVVVNLNEFARAKGKSRSYVIVRHDDLQYPICVYRIDDAQYMAMLMKCTHQGAELQVSGDQLTCPAHGSSFTKWGKVVQGPAASDLRTFPVSVRDEKLFIDLRTKS